MREYPERLRKKCCQERKSQLIKNQRISNCTIAATQCSDMKGGRIIDITLY